MLLASETGDSQSAGWELSTAQHSRPPRSTSPLVQPPSLPPSKRPWSALAFLLPVLGLLLLLLHRPGVMLNLLLEGPFRGYTDKLLGQAQLGGL